MSPARPAPAEALPAADDAAFGFAFEQLLGHEGGYVNDSQDKGGATKFGISIRFLGSIGLDIDGDGVVTNADVTALSIVDARRIYLDHFWTSARCNRFAPAVGFCLFDMAVNQGVRASVRCLQRALQLKDDGIVGPITIGRSAARAAADLVVDFQAMRSCAYADLNPDQLDRFGFGWFRRVQLVTLAASALARDGLNSPTR